MPTHKKVAFEATKEITREDILSDEQLARMAAAARVYGPKGEMYATIIELAPLLGLRISEMLALHWHHIEGRHLHVRVQLAEKFSPADPDSWFRALKGKADKAHGRTRKVTIPAAAIEILNRYRTWAFSQGLYRHDGLLFPTFSHTPMRQDQLAEVIRSTAATAIQRQVVFHHFRHIRASRLFDWGFGYDYVASQLGDTPAVIQATYVTFINDERAVALHDELEAAYRERQAS
jgi:integrase